MSAEPTENQESIRFLKGVGPALAEKLAKLGIHKIADVVFHLPLRYQDRTCVVPLGSLRASQEAVVAGTVEYTTIAYGRRRSLVSQIADGSGSLVLRFFHFNASLQERLQKGAKVMLFGEARFGGKSLEMAHPEFMNEADLDGSLTPIYPATEGIQQPRLRRIIKDALKLCLQQQALQDLLPTAVLQNKMFPSLLDAINTVHHPGKNSNLSSLLDGSHQAIQRLAFEELMAHQLSMRALRQQAQAQGAPSLKKGRGLQQKLVASLPFALTAAQKRVSLEIDQDLKQNKPMLRLVQGDVGSGKTLVAAAAGLRAVASGYQVAVMAPTEILAEQHFHNFQQWLEPLDIQLAYLASRLGAKAKRAYLQQVAEGVPVVIGTHALFQDDVEFRKLGLVIIDEQHRFGVHQRLALKAKGEKNGQQPHQLIMTATPIPRTLAMTAYADLDVSVIDELPPGRTPVQTAVLSESKRSDIVERINAACRQGRQAYWVCTLIEESEALQCQAAEDTAAKLSDALRGLKVGLVHGRMKAKEKDLVMNQFKAGEIKVLVATTVIEVGVDVPNASLMVIENAERLGLSQLHQLRGRVGRGQAKSTCLLIYKPPLGSTARKRLNIMRETTDGFAIAQEDLNIRGPGELLGTRQTGQLNFKIANLQRDDALLEDVYASADLILEKYPEYVKPLIDRWNQGAENYANV